MQWFRNIKYGIKNLWKWKSVIWNDRDWDYFFLLEITRFKLEQMAELQYKFGMSVNADKIGDELKRTAGLIELLSKHHFHDNQFQLDEKYGSIVFSNKTIQRKNKGEYSEEEYRRDLLKAIEEDSKNLKFIERKVFKLLKNYKNWWD